MDSWDNEEDSVATPEDEDGEDDEIGELAPKTIKKKAPKIEECKSKKEHVNVVFIGHVGECLPVCTLLCVPKVEKLFWYANSCEIDNTI